ncbi:hypothetical protein NC653_008333 [Populus alba x Populus x berolinensis]|uniref:A-kinase anchor protein 7-like phosphoesterase domain-containing protein n=1 Tax=Populus alba x Populus x berolinensis TaxID=444605 RepID=A0AAD6R6I1_9ROSI|nr:hypothetical protein NC653_008333 [Populus alba x Populus x berolinensis]
MDKNKNYKKKKQQHKAAGVCQFQWRPVSVSSSSSSSNIGESLVKDVANESEDGHHVQEVIKVAQVVADNSDSTISSCVLDDCVEPMLSAEKHSHSLQVDASLIHFIKGKVYEFQLNLFFSSIFYLSISYIHIHLYLQAPYSEDLLKKGLKRRWLLRLFFHHQRMKNQLGCYHVFQDGIMTCPNMLMLEFDNLINTFERGDHNFGCDCSLLDMFSSAVIEGISTDCVTIASEKIQAIIDEAIKTNLDYSHFVSLPLGIYPELVDKLVDFQNSILGINYVSVDANVESDYNEETSDIKNKGQELIEGDDVAVELKAEDDNHVKVDSTSIPFVSYPPKPPRLPNASDFGIDKTIFIKPATFHLTVLMLKLWNKERVNAASDVLKSISSKVIDALDNRLVSIRLKGLDTMRGSLSRARVLYAPVEEIGSEDRLLRACPFLEVIIDAFVEAGLVLEKDAKHKLKLHATVMNARNRKGKRQSKNDSFDARGVFKQFGSEDWGEYVIPEAHLSQRFVYDENGYYHCCASIPFPGKEACKMQTD